MMNIEQKLWSSEKGWQQNSAPLVGAQLVIVFGQRELLEDTQHFEAIRAQYPQAQIVLTSTSGEILGAQVIEQGISLTALSFEKTCFHVAQTDTVGKDSLQVGKQLASQFPPEGLRHILVFSEGSTVNGTNLVEGMRDVLGEGVTITGGLAGDGTAFTKTVVGVNEPPQPFKVVGLGFYGDALRVGFGSFGGWEPFGAERVVTKSEGNVLYTLDDRPALELYKTYLGDKAKELPAAALLFPLCIVNSDEQTLIRTILTIDEVEQTMTFAGDIPQGCKVRLAKSNHSKLVEGASTAAQYSLAVLGQKPALALLVSCVGRKLVLKQRVEEEIEAVKDLLGEQAFVLGFYSYGELAPRDGNTSCYLHNQTMTITLLTEE